VTAKQFIPAAFMAFWFSATSYAQPTQLSIDRNSGSVRLGYFNYAELS